MWLQLISLLICLTQVFSDNNDNNNVSQADDRPPSVFKVSISNENSNR